MSRKGGYKIIDLKGLDFSSNMVIDGIYEDIKDNYGKPLLFSGIVIDDVEKDDVFANVVVNGNGYDVTLYGQTLHISNVDVVQMVKSSSILTTSLNVKNGEDLYVGISTFKSFFTHIKVPNFKLDAGATINFVIITQESPGGEYSFNDVNLRYSGSESESGWILECQKTMQIYRG